jgi:TonB family protein
MMPALTAANLLAWSIQVAVIVLVGGATIHVARLPSPRVRLACFRALLIACLVLPFVQPLGLPEPTGVGGPASLRSGPVGSELQLGVTEPGLGAVSADVTPASASAERAAALRNASRPWLPGWAMPTAIIVLALGVAARLMWLLVGLLALGPLRRRAMPLRDHAPAVELGIGLAGASADVRLSAAVRRPVTFGVLRPVVLLPGAYLSLDETEQAGVLCHELLHVRRHDWLHTVVEEILRAVLWFHPGIWWLLGQIDLSREQLVDQEVVALTERRQSYLKALVTLALTPAGPILRPALLFLGRAHLLQRVALLSREVRMSRPRLVASLVVIAVALLLGGRFVVQAFPLAQASPAPVLASLPAASPAVAVPAGPASPAAVDQVAPLAEPRSAAGEATQTIAQVPRETRPPTPPPAVYKAEPTVWSARADQPASDADRIVVVRTTIEGGVVTEAQAISGDQGLVQPALDAVRSWQFQPRAGEPIVPVTTMIGFNFARGQQSGPASEPVRIGGAIPQPVRIRNISPVYPPEAQAKRMQGIVILEVTIDGAGIPIDAYALRPVEGLTAAAIDAALRWRYRPQPDLPRLLMTVTVNFTLQDSGAVVGGVAGGVSGGVAGGVQGGVTGGIVGGAPGVSPPPPPPPSGNAPVRVGGNIRQPEKLKDVAPVLPDIARAARVQGVVILEIVIGTDGKVQDAKILRSIPLFDQAAIDAVRQWEYAVTQLNGTPVPVIMTVTVNFTLGGSGGIAGGLAGGVPGGVAGGVGLVSSFGPPPSEWPQNVVRVGGEIKQPTKLVDVRPVYPREAQEARVQGVVIIEVLIGPDGKVQAGRILRSIPMFDQAALDAVGQWEYTRTLLNDAPVPIVMTVTVSFRLE